MDSYFQDIIRELGKKEFNTTDVVSTINQRKEWQKEYIKLSEQYGSYNKLNAQIGRYLANNQKKMGICKDGNKEVSISITGRRSPNQKWKVLLIPLLLLFVNISSYAQTLTPQQNSKSKWGYVNETGKAVIKHKYDEARAFSEELAAVKIYDKKSASDKWGFIDRTGKVIISLKYDGGVGDFSEEIARVKSNGKIGWIDRTGTEIIPLIYDATSPFIEEWAMVKKNGKLGFIDKTGKEIISVKYNEIGNFSGEGMAKVREGNNWGFIDKTGKEIIPVKYDEIGEFSETGLAKVRKGNNWGFIDKTGKEIVPVKYEEIGEFLEEEVAKIREGDNWGFIDKTGKVILPIEYNEVGAFNDGLAKLEKNKKFGFTDKTGKVIIPLKYDDAIDFSNGYAAYAYSESNFTFGGFVETKTHWGIIDKTGKEILLAEYTKYEINEMLSDPALLQKKIAKEAEKEMLTEDILTVLDNDYYSNESHSIEELVELIEKLKELIDDSSGKEKEQLEKLCKNLYYAVRTKVMTETHGVTIAKKIMAGKYEIGMSKEASLQAIADYVPLSLDMFSRGQRFVIDAKLYSETKTTEIWEVVAPGKKKMLWTFRNGKLASITNY